MEYNKILFDLIKKEKWNEISKIINKKEFDPNIRDDNNNYILTYLIMANKVNIVEQIIKKGARTNIFLDENDKSIIYFPIKFDNIDMVNILLKYDNLNIGVSILNVRDKNEQIPLHYAVQFKNMIIIKKLIEFGSDVNIQDINGLSSLHLAIFTKNKEICNFLLDTGASINLQNKTGDTPLHLACKLSNFEISKLLLEKGANVDIQDYEHGFTVLHHAVNLDYTEITNLILKYKPKINVQDIYGNTSLHYAILQSNENNIKVLIDNCNDINYNLWNISSKIPLHLLLEKKFFEIISDPIITKSNLNIQDDNGTTCLHLLCKFDLWKKFDKILKTKRLDVFVKNDEKKRPIDFINKNEITEFINMVADSYIFTLRHKNAIWKEEWENVCKKPTSAKKLNEIVDDKLNNNTDACHEFIVKKIKEAYSKNQYEFSSFPKRKDNICLKIDMEKNLQFCTFTGTSLDILIGLIYLLEKHKKSACSTMTSNFMINNDLCIFYKTIGVVVNSNCDFLNFEMVWTHEKLYVSSDFNSQFKKCQKRFIIIPLGIELKEGSHANYLIYDKNLDELERFEPHGNRTPIGFNYDSKLLDITIKNKFLTLGVKKYIEPIKYLPNISFQMLDAYDLVNKYIGDPNGFCALWAIWYVDMRLQYPDIRRDKLVRKLIKEIKRTNVSFKNLIRNYAKNVLEIRDAILSTGNIDINDWLNGKYTDEQYNNVINAIKLKLSKVL